jgi:plasmanylethanolamine desaturase
MSLYIPIWMAEPTLGSRIFCWCGIVANTLLILWCALWVQCHRDDAGIELGWVIVSVVAAVYLADFFSGFVHWMTDTWGDEVFLHGVLERVISIAREHHLYPYHIVGYGFRDYSAYSSWPNVAIVGPIALALTLAANPAPAVFAGVVVCLVISGIMVFGTHAHRLGHRDTRSKIVRILQNCRLLVTPSYHAVHHRGNHDIRYCVINGWANPLCDRIRLWRSLEWFIQHVTRALPRQNDRVWFDRFERDPNFQSARRTPVTANSDVIGRGGG